MKRLLTAALAAALFFGQMPTAQAVGTCASSSILMEASSGRVLYEQNSHERRLIASITKLMTALVALESGHSLDEVVTVSQAATGAEGSSIYLRPGEQITLEALLYGLMLKSGNDAALAIAEHCGGSVEKFVAQMNEKAAELGMKDSHFANPNGLNAQDHYSSAYDMALLARACLENDSLAQIVSTKTITIGARAFTNHNKLLWRYEGCIGMKTGYTEKAGRTLVSAARRDNLTLIVVTLNDPNDWADHTDLLDYGFARYTAISLTQAGQAEARLPVSGGLVPFVPVVAGAAASIAVGEGDEIDTELVWDTPHPSAPVEEGSAAGTLICRLNGEPVAHVPLVYGASVACNLSPIPTPLERLKEWISR